MAGSPKKRARREAERLKRVAETAQQNAAVAGDKSPVGNKSDASPQPVPTPRPQDLDVKHGEVLPPIREDQVTRTAFKRAMRGKAQQFADEAVAALALNLKSLDPKIRADAANSILKWSGLDKLDAGEIGGEGMQVVVLRFGQENDE